jgi:serine/threonine protein kinase
VVTKKQPESKPDKNSILVEYKQYIDTLDKGQSYNYRQDIAETSQAVSKNNFIFHFVVGKGGFGKVWRVESKKNKQFFAMKEMSKSKVISKRSVNSVMNERLLLCSLKHPYLVNMLHAFQDRENLYLVMDLMTGGDLRYHISRQRRFTEEQTKFFVGCIVVGLEYLHLHGILHRDIKPENLVLDMKGYVRITDLGIARIWRPDNSSDTSGTPGYMAPEVMCRQNHGVAVDYFALGIMTYEFMMGRRPYQGRSRKEIRDQILAKQVQIKKHEIPEGWSIEAADFINRLIQRKPINRLGLNGPAEVKAHPWIKNYPWQKLLNKEIDPPFLPNQKEDNFDYKQQITNEPTNPDVAKQNALLLRRNSVQSLFNGYHYDAAQAAQNQNNTTSSNHQMTISTASYTMKTSQHY